MKQIYIWGLRHKPATHRSMFLSSWRRSVSIGVNTIAERQVRVRHVTSASVFLDLNLVTFMSSYWYGQIQMYLPARLGKELTYIIVRDKYISEVLTCCLNANWHLLDSTFYQLRQILFHHLYKCIILFFSACTSINSIDKKTNHAQNSKDIGHQWVFWFPSTDSYN